MNRSTLDLPRGVVTFVMSDIEGSTRLWESEATAMETAMARHDQLIKGIVEECGGHLLEERGEGDGSFSVFSSGSDALAAAVRTQRTFATEPWATTSPIKIRVGIHTGFCNAVNGDYYGSAVNRCARVRSLGHGGQTLISMSTHEVIKDDPLPEGVSLRDLGEHFLKDLTRPERLFQIDIAELANDFPALSSVASTPNNLPRQLTEFVGRQTEASQLRDLVATCRLVTLLAPGGTGKTRLALHVAEEMLGEFPQGVFLVEMAPLSSPSQMVQAIAEAIDVPLSSEADLLDQLLRYLVNKRLLLILDNFEHLLDGAPVIGEILHTVPLVNVLATTRAKLGLSSEVVFTVPGLDTSWEAGAPQSDGARLFTLAAQRADPAFALSDEDRLWLNRILEMVEGMPLGILLAAGWADMLSMEEIASEIAKSADFLETQMGDVPDRHHSIRAVFDYSWGMLSAEERETFSALSVFRGGFTRDAAEYVAGASLRALSSLVDKALVTTDRTTGRFSVHELLRQYGEAHLGSTPDRHRQVTGLHGSFYSKLMEEATGLIHLADQPRAFATMEADLDNIRTAWRYYATSDDGIPPSNMIEGLWFLYEVRGWYPAALDLLEEASPTPVILAAQAWFQTLLSRPDIGVEMATRAAEGLRQSSNLGDLLLAVQSLCLSTMYSGDIPGLRAACEELTEISQEYGDTWWVLVGLCWSPFPGLLEGNLAETKTVSQTALDLSVRIGDHWSRTFALYPLGQVAVLEGRPEDALNYLQQDEAISRKIGYRRGLQWALASLGQASMAGGDLVSAEGYYLESLDTSYDLGQTREMLGVLLNLAGVRVARGDFIGAAELLGTILGDPTGSQLLPTDSATIHQSADQMRAELVEELDEVTLAEALRRGAARTTEVAAKELLTLGPHG